MHSYLVSASPPCRQLSAQYREVRSAPLIMRSALMILRLLRGIGLISINVAWAIAPEGALFLVEEADYGRIATATKTIAAPSSVHCWSNVENEHAGSPAARPA